MFAVISLSEPLALLGLSFLSVSVAGGLRVHCSLCLFLLEPVSVVSALCLLRFRPLESFKSSERHVIELEPSPWLQLQSN